MMTVNWSDVLELNCPDAAYHDVLFHKFNMFQNHFPVTSALMNNKQERSPYTSITSASRNNIKEKHRLEKLAHKWPLSFKEIYKPYRNKLTLILRVVRENCYKNQLKNNQGILSRIGNVLMPSLVKIHPLLSSLKLSWNHCLDIPNKSNNHFLKSNENQSNINDENHLKYLTNIPSCWKSH